MAEDDPYEGMGEGNFSRRIPREPIRSRPRQPRPLFGITTSQPPGNPVGSAPGGQGHGQGQGQGHGQGHGQGGAAGSGGGGGGGGAGPVTGDPYWGYTVLLLGFEGANNSTGAPGMTDESGHAHGNAIVQAGAKIITSQKKFGGSSLALNGAGDYLQFTDNIDWNFGTDPFTVEGFWRFVGSPTGGGCLWQHWPSDWAHYFEAGSMFFRATGSAIDTTHYSWTPTLGQWYHIAFDRDVLSVARQFVDGVMVSKNTGYNSFIGGGTNVLAIGSLRASFTGYDINGDADDLRITKGMSRYGSDTTFSVPTSAFPRGLSSSWAFTFTAYLPDTSASWSGYNMRQLLDNTLIKVSGGHVRVTLQSAQFSGCTVDSCWIGHQGTGNPYDFDGNQVQLFFNSAPGFTILGSVLKVSDSAIFNLDETKNLIISMHFSGASDASTRNAGTTGATSYWKLGADESGVTHAAAGYSNNATSCRMINLIEVSP